MNRRNFLKALGLGTTASALSACDHGLDDNRYYTPVEQLLPYVVKPENIIPGVPTFFATSVTRGPEAHPVLARHRDGRVIHVGANKRAPYAPAVPKAALLELQKHYSPDRYKQPMEGTSPVTWDDAVPKVVAAVQAAKSAGKKVAWLGGYRSGTIVDLIGAVADHVVMWEAAGYEAEANAAELVFGSRFLPRYDLAGAHYVLSFGANILNGWGGTRLQSEFAAARNPNQGHVVARYAHVSPYRDQSGANADDWIAVAPGTEVLVARAIASLVAKKTGASGPAVAAIGTVDVAAAASAAGVDVAALEAVASQFAAGHAVALPGGSIGAGRAATDLAAATYLLNMVGKDTAPQMFSAGGYRAPVSSTADVEALVAEMNAGNVGVLFIDDANPVHLLPGMDFAAALAKVGTSIALTSHPDETTALCKMVLPSADTFEDWGDEEPLAGMTLVRQPTMSPIDIKYRPPGEEEQVSNGWDVRSAGDLLVTIGKATAGVTSASWKDYLRERWARLFFDMDVLAPARERARLQAEADGTTVDAPVDPETGEPVAAPGAHTDPGFPRWFNKHLAAGYYKGAAADAPRMPQVTGTISWSADTLPTGAGDMVAILVPHAHVGDGRYANTPWAQELPDPMSGIVWDSWAEIHPDTAAKLGVSDRDEVSITGEGGSITAGVEVTKSVRPDVVAVQLGQGHTAAGRYANGVGQNAAILAKGLDAHGAMAWSGNKVSVKATGNRTDLVHTFGGDSDEDRNFAVLVNAEQLAEKGDAPSAHPGDMTGIHHLELDKRLVENKITDFYGLTQHPTYRFGMTVDTDACTGCGACSIACYAENNLPVVGREKVRQGREMSWIRVNRYFKGDDTFFVPMMCQHCGHAPCESVCPVLATYHNLDGLNAMIYNRCVGTRYCSNACPFSARKFNYHTYVWPEPFNMQLNPDVVTRTMGVMEKCTFCIQRIRGMKTAYKDAATETTNYNAVVPDAALQQLPACAEACPSQALTFGNLNDESSLVSQARHSGRKYMPLEDLNVFSAVNYLAKSSFHKEPPAAHHGGGHGGAHGATDHGEGGDHGKADDHGGDHGKAGDDHGKADGHH
jgi:molybdopterin-containing oxidoreductase family iron-sulfur binding subunit